MKVQQKKLSGCASNSLAHEDLGHFEEAHHWNIQASLYEEHGATLKHKCGKRDSNIAPFYLFYFFFFSSIGPFFFSFGLSPFFIWDNALLMMIITLLFIYNSMITTRY